MKATSTVTVSVRVPTKEWRVLVKAAAIEGKKLATFVREAAVLVASETVEREHIGVNT